MGVSWSGREGIGASNGCLGARVLGCLGCQLEIVRGTEEINIVVVVCRLSAGARNATGDRDRDRAAAAWTGDGYDANLGTTENREQGTGNTE